MSGAYLAAKPGEIRATLALLRHYRAFSASDCQSMRDPTTGWHGVELDKPAAAHRLRWLVLVAINRKAGVPEEPGGGHRAQRRLAAMREREIRERGCFECGAHLGWLSAETASRMVIRNPQLARELTNNKTARSPRFRGWGRYVVRASGDYSRPYHRQPHYCGAC